MKLLTEDDVNSDLVQFWRDDDCNLIKITISRDGTETEEDMQECACSGCWENR